MNRKKTILIIGPFPEPISGVSIANKVVKEILTIETDFLVKAINTSFTSFDERIGKFSFVKLFFYLSINFHFSKIFKSDIIYITPGQTFFGIMKYAFFIIISSILRKELIIHVHGNYLGQEYRSLKGIKKWIFHFLVSRFTKGIVLSASLKQNLTPFISENCIFCLPNFAQNHLIKDDKKLINNELRIFYLSNLMKEKGILCLLKALKKLEFLNIKYKAKIAGNIDQKYSKEIFQILSELKHTKYIGVVKGDKKRSLLEWGNIFILPTFYKMEGQPISILEAMATKNLIVTTRHAGIPDIFEDKVNGYYIEKNSVESIQNILSYLAVDKSEIVKISNYNREYFFKNFTIDKFKKTLLEIIK